MLLTHHNHSPRNWAGLVLLLAFLLWASHSAVHASEDPALIAYPALVSPVDSDLTLDIISLRNSWSIQLREKSLLGSVSSVQTALFEIPEFFNGVVIGETKSWVRLARDSANSVLTGHIFSNGILYELQHRTDMGGHAIARLANSPSQLSTITDAAADNTTISSRTIANDDLNLSKAIRIGIVVDSRYNEQHNGRGLAHALGVINGVDGLYQNQLGLAVVVESFRVYENPATDPLRELTGTADELLERYRNERLRDSELSKELALVHLFSGLRDPQKVIGLGWISTACSVNGYDLSLSTPFPFDILLAAHEIAHNLGAIHDDDAQCMSDESITGAEVMWSELSGSTRPMFSSCSMKQLRQTVNTAECVADNIDVSIALNATPLANSDQQLIQVTVFNQDLSRRANQINSLTTFPLGSALSNPSAGCTVQGVTLACQHGSIKAREQNSLSITAHFSDLVNPVVTTELKVALFMDTRHQDNRAAIQIDPNSAVANGSNPANPAASPASGDSALASSDQFIIQAADDQSVVSPDSGGSAGVRAGRANILLLLILSLFALLQTIRMQSGSLLNLVIAFNRIARNTFKRVALFRFWQH